MSQKSNVKKGIEKKWKPNYPIIMCIVILTLTMSGCAKANGKWIKDFFVAFAAAEAHKKWSESKRGKQITCITNGTGHKVNYFYRWGTKMKWERYTMAPGEYVYHWNDAGYTGKFYVEFDKSYSSGNQSTSYSLGTRRSTGKPTCQAGTQYRFYKTSNGIDIT